MMELTPLDVRKKKGDFRRGLRGYEPGLVDDFLDIVADRLEALVRETAALKEQAARLEQQVADYRDREKALTEALVTAQEMREEIRAQSAREVDLLRRQAEQEAEAILRDAVRAREREEDALKALRNKQLQFLANFRAYLEQELSELEAHGRAIEMQGGRPAPRRRTEPAPAAEPRPSVPPARREPGPGGEPPTVSATPGSGIVAGGSAAVAVGGRAPAPPEAGAGGRGPRGVVPAEAADVDAGHEEIEGQVGAALAEWSSEFDEAVAEAPDLILSDEDVVVEDELAENESGRAKAESGPGPSYDESAFRADVKAAFGGSEGVEDDLLDLESFDSLRSAPDLALGESIVGPPPVIPPDELTISQVFLERARPGSDPEGDEGKEAGNPPRPDMFSTLFGEDG